jgi:site-specific recombinase XerD
VAKDTIGARTTANQLTALMPSANRRYVSDETVANLFLAIEPGGTKTWRYDAAVRAPGKGRIKMTLGRYPAFGLADAREWAAERNAERDRGKDPRLLAIAREAHSEASKAHTVKSVWEDWIAHKRRVKEALSSLGDYNRLVRSDMLETIGDKPLADVTKADISKIIRTIQERGAVAGANRFLVLIKQWLAWAAREDIVRENVAEKLKGTKEVATRRGSRHLTIEELALAWRASVFLTPEERDASRLLILTGARKLEALAAASVDYIDGIWTIPRLISVDEKGKALPVSHSKTHREHPIILPKEGRAIFEERAGNEFLFATVVHKYMLPDLGEKLNEQMVKLSGRTIPKWTLHGIRKGVETAITSDEMIESGHWFGAGDASTALNHAVNIIQKTYNHGRFAKRNGHILAAWHDLLMAEVRRQEEG